jgi:hypothetical protein
MLSLFLLLFVDWSFQPSALLLYPFPCPPSLSSPLIPLFLLLQNQGSSLKRDSSGLCGSEGSSSPCLADKALPVLYPRLHSDLVHRRGQAPSRFLAFVDDKAPSRTVQRLLIFLELRRKSGRDLLFFRIEDLFSRLVDIRKLLFGCETL